MPLKTSSTVAQNRRATSLAVCLATLSAMVKAELTIRCEFISNPSIQALGDWDTYTQAGDSLACYAFELMCLENKEGSIFTLEAKSIAE